MTRNKRRLKPDQVYLVNEGKTARLLEQLLMADNLYRRQLHLDCKLTSTPDGKIFLFAYHDSEVDASVHDIYWLTRADVKNIVAALKTVKTGRYAERATKQTHIGDKAYYKDKITTLKKKFSQATRMLTARRFDISRELQPDERFTKARLGWPRQHHAVLTASQIKRMKPAQRQALRILDR